MRHGFVSLIGAALVLAGGAAAAQDVSDAARKEGTLTLYNGTSLQMIHVIADLFKARTGLGVDILDGRAGEVVERIRTEQASGRAVGDIVYNGANTNAAALAAGMLEPHGPLANAALLDPHFADDGTITPISSSFFAILVSATLVPEAVEPHHWQDLIDPQWRGKILSDDFRAAGAGEVFFNVMLDQYGRGFHDKLAAQAPQFSRFFAESERRIARGEFALYIPLNVSEIPNLEGLPVRAVIPDEGVPYVTLSLAMLKGAPHPNAARLFMNFAISKEAQAASGKTGAGITVTSIADQIPPAMRRLAQPKLLGASDPARFQDMLKLAAEIYR
jgi:iron(III) transport system substrate-binding protein